MIPNVAGVQPSTITTQPYFVEYWNIHAKPMILIMLITSAGHRKFFFLSSQSANPQPNFNVSNPQPQVRNWTFKSLVRNRKSATTFQDSWIRNRKSATS